MSLRTFFFELFNVANKYFIVAGIAFLIVYVVLRKRIAWRKIQLKFPSTKDYRRELLASAGSMIIFAVPPLVLLGDPAIRVHSTIYAPISQRGWVYFCAVFPLLFVVHDAYFYWMHRLIHHPRLFK